jgi:hypothetical protein
MRNMASFCTVMDIGFNIPEIIDEPSEKPILDPDWVLGLTQLARREHSVLSGEEIWPWLDEDEDGEESWTLASISPKL